MTHFWLSADLALINAGISWLNISKKNLKQSYSVLNLVMVPGSTKNQPEKWVECNLSKEDFATACLNSIDIFFGKMSIFK